MASSLPFLLLLLLFSAAAAAASAGNSTLTAYEALQSFGFPSGLLPEGALGYDLDASSGRFSAYLSGDCSFSLEGSYQLKYKPTISGVISPGRITGLQGVTVKVFLFWINIIEISRSGNELQFSVGIASADFPVSNFDESPRCGCGVDCAGKGSADA